MENIRVSLYETDNPLRKCIDNFVDEHEWLMDCPDPYAEANRLLAEYSIAIIQCRGLPNDRIVCFDTEGELAFRLTWS